MAFLIFGKYMTNKIKFIFYFDRMGKKDWVIHIRGKKPRLTKKIVCYADIRSCVRNAQPRAVMKGSAYFVQITRLKTYIFNK